MKILKKIIQRLKPYVERNPFLATLYRDVQDNLALTEKPQKTPFGFSFLGIPLMQTGDFEPEELKVVQEFLGQVEIFVNVGANTGFYCCHALQAGVKTIAFEPMTGNARLLYKNVKNNKWEDRIEIFPLALGSVPGLIEIFGKGTGASIVKGWAGISEDFSTLVPVSNIDTILGDRLSGKKCFFLVDIEGAELEFLRGAPKHLALKPQPTWLVEISITEHQPKAGMVNPNLLKTFQMFWDAGYEARTANERRDKVLPSDVEKMAETGENPFNAFNFLFLAQAGN